MPCRRASQLISESMDRPLSFGEGMALRVHLLLCGFCKRYKRQLLVIRTALRTQLTSQDQSAVIDAASLSPEARQRIAKAISRES